MKIYNMDIGWGMLPDGTQMAILDGLYDMMDHDRGAKLPFDIILSNLSYDGLETITLTATQMPRYYVFPLHDEFLSLTLGELFG